MEKFTIPPPLKKLYLEPSPSSVPRAMVLSAAGFSGAVFFLMELVWYRMLSPLLGGTTFNFGLILAMALLGMALGNLAYSLWRANRPVTLAGLALVWGLEALCLALPFAIGDWLAVFAIILHPLGSLGIAGKLVSWSLVTFAVVFPTAFCAGLQFPMLVALFGQGRTAVGAQTGKVYAWNTAGAIAGSLAGGFGLLPWLTAPGVWRLAVAVLVAGAAVALGRHYFQQRRLGPLAVPLATAGAAALLVLQATGPTAVWRHTPIGAGRVEAKDWTLNACRSFLHNRRMSLFWEEEGRESSIALAHSDGLALMVNGKSDGNARGDAGTQVMLGLLGALVHPQARTALVIGLGTGSSAGWLGTVPSIGRVDVVELEPAVVRAAAFCAPVNCRALANPKVHVRIGDAREVMLTTHARYDVIASEPSNPYRAGVASLYTREFYEAAAGRLQPQGLFVQWVQAYEVDGATIDAIYATLGSVFPEIDTWRSTSGDMLLVASREPIVYDLSALRARLQTEPYRSAVAHVWRVNDVEGLFARYVANSELANAVAAEHPFVNTDDRNQLEFTFAWTVGAKTTFNLDALTEIACEGGFNWPHVSGGQLDQRLIADRTASSLVLDRGAKLIELDTPAFRARLAAKQAYAKGELSKVVRDWQSQSQPPGDLVELLILAHSLATLGATQTLAYAGQLRAWNPSEADAVLARYWCTQGELDRGFGLFERAFAAWRTNAWAASKLVHNTIQAAAGLAVESGSRRYAWAMFQALRKPFAVEIMNNERLAARLKLAAHLDEDGFSHFTHETVVTLEPDVPWNRSFLQLRADCYAQAKDARAALAQRDLARFDQAESVPFACAAPPEDGLAQQPYKLITQPASVQSKPPSVFDSSPLPVHARTPAPDDAKSAAR